MVSHLLLRLSSYDANLVFEPRCQMEATGIPIESVFQCVFSVFYCFYCVFGFFVIFFVFLKHSYTNIIKYIFFYIDKILRLHFPCLQLLGQH